MKRKPIQLEQSIATDIHKELIANCLQGDDKAYERLYRLYAKAMYNTALRIVIDEDEARDMLQESFITAFKKLDSFQWQSTFGAWLKKIVMNNCLDLLRKKKRLFVEQFDHEHHDVNDDWGDWEWEDKQIDQLKSCIDQLPEGYKLVLNLYLFEGYDHQEIAEILTISESTSKSQYHRAKKKLIEIAKNKLSYENGR